MKILLSGANGNLGVHFRQVTTGHEIIQLNRGDWSELDKKLENTDLIMHMAADIRSKITEHPVAIVDSNILSTARLLEGAKRHEIKKFCFISSSAVYGEANTANEERECCPSSLNGKMKLLNEDMIAAYCAVNNIDYHIFRVFNTFGGEDKFSIVSYLMKAAKTGAPFFLNNGGISQRDFVHVKDVAEVLLKLLELDQFPCYLNIGTGKTTAIIELFEMVKKKYPAIAVKSTYNDEVEYSRADMRRINEYVSHDYIDIKDYLQELLS